MSFLYDSLIKGHKIAITTKINEMCRGWLVNNDWDIDLDETVDAIHDEMLNFYFVVQVLNLATEDKEEEEFSNVLKRKIRDGINSFRNQKPTMNQIYRYVNASLDFGERPRKIETNEKIWLATSRLERIVSNMGEEERKLRTIE